MATLESICELLEQWAPAELAEPWDNVGLLAGDRSLEIRSIMTCLTITPASAAEAVSRGANLVITHHPLPFHALKRLTTDAVPGRLLWELIGQRIAIYSPHTSYDSAAEGINQQLAEGLQLAAIAPLVPNPETAAVGTGRYGQLAAPTPLLSVAGRLKHFLQIEQLGAVGHLDHPVRRVGVACGAAGSLLDAARRAACQVLVLGETNLHTCLEAEADRIALLITGHYASERFAVERLAERLAESFPALTVWPSKEEKNPLRRI